MSTRLTLGTGMGSMFSVPRSCNKFLMRMDRSATSRATCISTLSEVTMGIICCFSPSVVVEAICRVVMLRAGGENEAG